MKMLTMMIFLAAGLALIGLAGSMVSNSKPATASVAAPAQLKPSIEPNVMMWNAPLDMPSEMWNPI